MTAPVQTPEDIKAQYGFVALLAQAIPEVGSLMQQAVGEKWTAERFQLALANTNWWKNTDAANRQWVSQQYADPATARAQLESGGFQIANQAERLGFYRPSAAQAQNLWLQSRLQGLDERNTDAFLFRQLRSSVAGLPEIGGEYGQLLLNMRQLASQYGYSPPGLEQEIRLVGGDRMAAGSGADELAYWRTKLTNYAASKYAPFADRIQAGETVRDIAQPYIDVYAQTLELNPQDVGLDDRYVERWLQGRTESGKPPAATPVWQAQQELRKDERWQYTRNAWESMADVANAIGRSFGMHG